MTQFLNCLAERIPKSNYSRGFCRVAVPEILLETKLWRDIASDEEEQHLFLIRLDSGTFLLSHRALWLKEILPVDIVLLQTYS